jgi:hypothetical protein
MKTNMSRSAARAAMALPLLLTLGACTAPTGGDDGSAASTESALSPIHILPPTATFVEPSYYTALSGQTVRMQSSTESICLLQGVSGSFTGSSSVAWIYATGGYYYLAANGSGQATAACAPLSDFTGTGTSSVSSTAASPYWVAASLPQDDVGYNSNSLNLWSGPQAACFLSGFAGDWSGIDTGATQTTSIDQVVLDGSHKVTLETNGAWNKVWANCYEFPGRSSMTIAGSGEAFANGSQSVSLNAKQNVGLCGLDLYDGTIDLFAGGGGDSAYIQHDSQGNQSIVISGSVVEAHAYCLAYSQGS